MNKQEFANIMAALETSFNTKFTREKANIYFENLDDLDYITCQKAVKKLIQTTEYPPTVAAIRKSYSDVLSGSKPSLEQTLNDMNKLTKYPYGRYKTVEGMEWLKENNPTAYRIMKSLGYMSYANNEITYLMPTINKLHKEIVENDTDVKLLQSKFIEDLSKAKMKALSMNGEEERW